MLKMSWKATVAEFKSGGYDWSAVRNMAVAAVAVVVAFVTKFSELTPDQLVLLPAGLAAIVGKITPYVALLATLIASFRASQSLPPILPPTADEEVPE
jgi:membrane protein DedA with SNARE-associated domain